jgi:WD40 repeat protein
VWNGATGRQCFQLTGFVPPLQDLFWSRDGKTIIGLDSHQENVWIPQIRQGLPELRRNVVLWDAATGRQRARLKITAGFLGEGSPLSPDGKTLADFSGVNRNDPLTLWDTATWRRRITLEAYSEARANLGWSPNSRTLASLTMSDVVLWDASTGRRRAVLSPGAALNLAWRPDGTTLAVSSGRWGMLSLRGVAIDPPPMGWRSGAAVLWRPGQNRRHIRLTGAGFPVAWTAEGTLLVTGNASFGGNPLL